MLKLITTIDQGCKSFVIYCNYRPKYWKTTVAVRPMDRTAGLNRTGPCAKCTGRTADRQILVRPRSGGSTVSSFLPRLHHCQPTTTGRIKNTRRSPRP